MESQLSFVARAGFEIQDAAREHVRRDEIPRVSFAPDFRAEIDRIVTEVGS